MTKELYIDSHDGEVMQIDVRSQSTYAGCFISVTHKLSWGILGYLTLPDRKLLYLRVSWKDLKHVGFAASNNDEYFNDPVYVKAVKKRREDLADGCPNREEIRAFHKTGKAELLGEKK